MAERITDTTDTQELNRLAEIRARIDEIDTAFVALWAERNRLAAEAGDIKREEGTPVRVHGRDIEVRTRFADMCEREDIRREVGHSVISAIMTTSYEAQRVPVDTSLPRPAVQ